MQPRTEARIDGWEPRSTNEGYAGLRGLADAGFSGVVAASGATLFMLGGRVVGIADGSIDDFEDATLAAREAPHRALPLLFAMDERGGETQATYYTNDTPIQEATETLESGGFTGYLELSENVLSGEYYRVYHQGRSMCVAFVGSEDRLLTDEEAASRMDEEIGVYTVEAVEVHEISIPEPADDPLATRPDESTGDERTPEDEVVAPEGDVVTTEDDVVTPGDDVVTSEVEVGDDPDATAMGTPPAHDTETGAETAADTESDPPATAGSAGNGDPDLPPAERATADDGVDPARSEATDPRERWGSVVDDPVEDRIAAERQWRETNRIPSIDPERSSIQGGDEAVTVPAESEPTEPAPQPGEELLSRALDALETERAARQETEETVAKLQAEVARLEDRLATIDGPGDSPTADEKGAGADATAGSTPERSLDPETALSGTNLFVRYASKGAATLETAHAGEADRETLEANLRLERRTGFDASEVAIEGDPFEAFLTARPEYRFAEWLVCELPFEIARTGHDGSMSGLYDALPAIDRIQFGGSIEVGVDSEDESVETRRFDVICRDRMGEALFVTNCIDAHAATTDEQVASLVEAASEVAADGELAGAMLVTTSYFDPGALATAEEATQSGLFGGSRESYVTISRRTGYHLCLVETHDGTFHVAVPEL